MFNSYVLLGEKPTHDLYMRMLDFSKVFCLDSESKHSHREAAEAAIFLWLRFGKRNFLCPFYWLSSHRVQIQGRPCDGSNK